MKEIPIAVIGAGPCGLAACKALAEKGLAYECLEASSQPGGIWNVERGSGGYRSLQTNTSVPGMAYSDFPFPQDSPVFPNAQQMISYFNRYADHFQLRQHICFNQRVTLATPQSDGSWCVQLDNGEQREYSKLVVATGQYTAPRRPHESIPGSFSGQHLHVFDYLDASAPLDMSGKRVMVVGLGSSAAEVAAELSNPDAAAGCAAQVILSARSGRWVAPKLFAGKPMDARSPHASARLPAAIRALPGDWGQWLARRAMGKALRSAWDKLGGAQGLGLPQPSIQPWEDRPSISFDFIPALQAGRIDVRPGITRFDGQTVVFSDGSQTEADIILYATGYELNFPFLSDATLGCPAPDLKLYQRISHPEYDSLFFVGCCRVMCSLWPLAEQQSCWLARLLAGDFMLPSADRRARGAVSLQRSLPIICNFAVEELRKEAGGL
jgi:dimethylaniline monooxygenase (N-oxide forming)